MYVLIKDEQGNHAMFKEEKVMRLTASESGRPMVRIKVSEGSMIDYIYLACGEIDQLANKMSALAVKSAAEEAKEKDE
jgi:hypothetical protein